MSRIEKIDHNFQACRTEEELKWSAITARTPGLSGLLAHPDGGFCRLPPHVVQTVTAQALRPTVQSLYRNTSGGRLHFRTDSRTVAVRAHVPTPMFTARTAHLGTAGFDLYERRDDGWRFAGIFAPEQLCNDAFTATVCFADARPRELLLNFPLYADVAALELGLSPDAFWEAVPVREKKKVVFYGSSITQGGCAPRPGLSYPGILGRRLDLDWVNLGFSDGARVEPGMLEYLCSLDMDALVFDYDHNAPDTEFLRRTHLPAFQYLRERRPSLPILIASAPMAHPDAIWRARRDIIIETWQWALAQGDRHVRFADGAAMFPPHWAEECSIDGIHPNGLGMSCMADAMEPLLRELLK